MDTDEHGFPEYCDPLNFPDGSDIRVYPCSSVVKIQLVTARRARTAATTFASTASVCYDERPASAILRP